MWEQRQDLTRPMSDCTSNRTSFAPAAVFDEATLIRCDVRNTSLSANFEIAGGEQLVRVTRGPSSSVNGSNWFR